MAESEFGPLQMLLTYDPAQMQAFMARVRARAQGIRPKSYALGRAFIAEMEVDWAEKSRKNADVPPHR